MKYLAGILALFGIATALEPLPTVDPKDFKQLNFTNRKDHFDYFTMDTYEQRYWVNEKFWIPESGPVFIYICGEYTCSVPETRLFPFMVAATHNASMYVLEHRFYGASQLEADWTIDNLQLLSSE